MVILRITTVGKMRRKDAVDETRGGKKKLKLKKTWRYNVLEEGKRDVV